MNKTEQITFRVEGAGDFPLDMLRYDRCFPAAGVDVETIRADGARRVTLLSDRHPTPARWDSFGWRVVHESR